VSFRSGVITGVVASALVVGAFLFAQQAWKGGAATEGPKPASPAAPFIVDKPLKEDGLNRIELSASAVARLNLQTARVEKRSMPRTRAYGGEVVVPPGRSIVVSAPLGGTLAAPSKGDGAGGEGAGGGPQVGASVRRGQVVWRLSPILTPEGRANLAASRIEAEGQTKTAAAQHEAARVALERARRVFESDVGSRRALDDAQAQYEVTQKGLAAAEARYDVLVRVGGAAEAGTSAPLDIESPRDGILRNVTALAGQAVPAGGTLFEVVDLATVWIRVPIYVGEHGQADTQAAVSIGELTPRKDARRRIGKPAPAPPSADPLAGTADLYYVVDNADGRFRPGERVAVDVPQQGETESLVVPWSAVVYDIYGGTWVYVETGERTYVRRRVAVRTVTGNAESVVKSPSPPNPAPASGAQTAEAGVPDAKAVLASGPDAGTKVVVAGAAELFGTETGFTK
jgi:hypothetical protein